MPVLNNNANDNYSVSDLRKQQTKILDDQNVGLEALSKVISRQKHLAVQIGEEVDLQNGLFLIIYNQFCCINKIYSIF